MEIHPQVTRKNWLSVFIHQQGLPILGSALGFSNSWDQIQKVPRKFQVFPGLPHRWIATSRCRGSDWPRSARPLSAVAERSHASALPVASPWPQQKCFEHAGMHAMYMGKHV